MDCEGPSVLLKKLVLMPFDSDCYSSVNFADGDRPLEVDEVIWIIRQRWHYTYDLQLIVREKRIYLQMMWGYLEQQSFPLDEENYKIKLSKIIEILNRVGQAGIVRNWLFTCNQTPRLGRAVTFPLDEDPRLKEFLL